MNLQIVIRILSVQRLYSASISPNEPSSPNSPPDTFGDASQQTLLRQQISGAVNNSPSLVGSARQLIRGLTRGAERVLTPDPMQYATNLVKGNPRVPYGLVGMPGTGLDKVISTISPELQRMGLNAGHAEEAAKRLFKVYLIDRFAQPNSVTGTGQ